MMDDWPRLDERRYDGDGAWLSLYRRDDEAGRGHAMSLHVTGEHGPVELMRFDLFDHMSHEHWADAQGAPRRYYPHLWPWRQRVDLACFNLPEHAPLAMEACPDTHVRDVPSKDWLYDAMRWAKAQLLHPPTQVVIPCAGRGERWAGYLDVPKHFVRVDGQPLLDRLIAQVGDMGWPSAVVKPAGDNRYVRDQTFSVNPSDEDWGDLGKVMSVRTAWPSTFGRTIILFGDVHFSRRAIWDLHDATLGGDWSMLARLGPHPEVRKPWGEAFGLAFWHYHHEQIHAAASRVVTLRREDRIDGASLWHLYRALIDLPDALMGEMLAGPHVTWAYDWTHDFDLPDDWERYMGAAR